MFKVAPYGVATHIKRVVNACGGHAGGSFRQAVDAGHFHIHLFFHLLHQFHRAKGARHDACAQAGHVKEVEHGVVQLGNEHRRHAVECRTAFLVYRSKNHQRVETFHHDLCTAMSEAVHRGKHHAEAVEQGHAAAQFVVSGEFHVLTGEKSVVGDVVVGEHYTFRETGGA